MALFFIFAVLPLAAQTCRPVDGERIRMGDLATVDPRFSAADPKERAGLAPQPGIQRVFWPLELMQLAKRSGIIDTAPFSKMCFERRTRLVTPEEVAAAVRAWAPVGSQIAVLEQSKFPAPVGTLEIPQPSAIRTGSDGAVLLRGFVLFDESHKFPVWARVRVTVKQRVAVATEPITAGSEIREDQLKTEEREGGIEQKQLVSDPARAAGRVARKRFAAGEAIAVSFLEEPKQVKSGAVVAVEVRNGATRLSLEARAETSGRVGETVTVRNPASGKSFPARVTGVNAVVVFPRGFGHDGREPN